MVKEVTLYKCKMVKEDTVEYESQVKCSDDLVEIARKIGFDEYAEEHLGVFCLNSAGKVVGYSEVSHGDLSSSQSHPREIFKRAILLNSACIALVHNHPSGNAHLSEADKTTTQRIKDAGELIGVKLIDHIVIGFGGDYVSAAAHGLL